MESESEPVVTMARLVQQRAAIQALAAKHGMSNVRVLGSVARGEATARSDVDLLVTPGPAASIFDAIALWRALEELLDCEVNLLTDGATDAAFQARIVEEIVTL